MAKPLITDPEKLPKAFQATNVIPRSPRAADAPTVAPDTSGSPSTLEKVRAEKEARRELEVKQHEMLLAQARAEYFDARKRLLAVARSGDIETKLVLEWSQTAESMGKSFAHRSNRKSADHSALPGAEPTADEPVPAPAMTLAELRQQWVEATCLLRSDMATAESFDQARRVVRVSLQFIDNLSALAVEHAAKLPGGTGTIFQELLNDLAVCGVAGMMIDNLGSQGGSDGNPSFEDAARDSAMAGSLGAKDEWPQLLAQANDLRCIVRIKLQDANDLKAAEYALECCSTCFQEISAHAKARGISNFEMAQVLDGPEE